ncbi:ribose-phosphate diphosphokinase [Phytobacter ursingii]|uniref:ribose-phosphate diphosphokinase n=1 Tax=Phytobacter ursingii TaxID=1972431 RepID=UPI000CD1717F|nr:ribose-phosphate pyrophosphokinase [Enterobacteriaceae bacterium ENNIH1]RDT55302.1 ribose-phosphate diphosphokinase [Escherichia coli]
MTSKIELTLDNQPVEIERGIFPDGAVWLRVMSELPRFAQVMRVRVAAMRDMNDFMLLAQLTDAVRHATDIQVSHLELAWLPWARQDRHMVNGDSFALKVFANQLNVLNFDKVFLLDPHSDVAAAAINNSVVIAQESCLMKSEKLRQAISSGKLMLVAPDAGALKKIHNVAKASGARDYAILTKERDVATGNLTGFALVSGDVAGKDVLIVDDLCDAGGTFIGSAQVLRDAGARSVSLYVTHGVFSRGVENLLNNGIDAIYTTTSFASSELREPHVEFIDIDTIFCA